MSTGHALAEACLNLRTITEWTIAANSEKSTSRSNLMTTPLQAFINGMQTPLKL